MKINKFDLKDLTILKNKLNIKDEPSSIENNLIKKTIKYIKYIKWIPGIQMIGVCNSVSMNAATNKSDIDLFIITSPNKIWLVRIFITAIFQILGVRKTKNKHAWKFCLSFFVTTKWLDFSNFALENDIYLYFWTIYLKPILNYDNSYEKFINTNSSWANFDEYKQIITDNKKYIKYSWKTFWDNSKILNLINKAIKKMFIWKTLKHYKKIWKPFWIIIGDDILKFHDKDERVRYCSLFDGG